MRYEHEVKLDAVYVMVDTRDEAMERGVCIILLWSVSRPVRVRYKPTTEVKSVCSPVDRGERIVEIKIFPKIAWKIARAEGRFEHRKKSSNTQPQHTLSHLRASSKVVLT